MSVSKTNIILLFHFLNLLSQKKKSSFTYCHSLKIRFPLMFVVPKRMKAIAVHSNRRSGKAIFPTESDRTPFANSNQSFLAGRAMEFTNEWVSPSNNLYDQRIIIGIIINYWFDLSIYLMGFNHWIRIEFNSRKKQTSCLFLILPFDGLLSVFSCVFDDGFIGSIYGILSVYHPFFESVSFSAKIGKIAMEAKVTVGT